MQCWLQPAQVDFAGPEGCAAAGRLKPVHGVARTTCCPGPARDKRAFLACVVMPPNSKPSCCFATPTTSCGCHPLHAAGRLKPVLVPGYALYLEVLSRPIQ